MGATVIFWTPICASRPRLGSGRLLPRRGKSRPRRAGALARRVGALTRLIMKRYRSLLGSSAADGADESSGAIIRVSQGGRDVQSAGLLADPLTQEQKLRMVNR